MMQSVYLAIRYHLWLEPTQTWGARYQYSSEPIDDRVLLLYNINAAKHVWMHVCHPYLIHNHIRRFQAHKDQKRKRHSTLAIYYKELDPSDKSRFLMTVDGQICHNFYREMNFPITYMTSKNSMNDTSICGKCRKPTPKSARAKLFLFKMGDSNEV